MSILLFEDYNLQSNKYCYNGGWTYHFVSVFFIELCDYTALTVNFPVLYVLSH